MYLAILPACLLADLYANLRDHASLKGTFGRSSSVWLAANKGIRETILNKPSRFLAYNNGISATAADVSLTDLDDGGIGITEIRDLQIVNGGQTTASGHHAATRDKADLAGIAVQAKLTVVKADVIDDMVPRYLEILEHSE